MNLYNSCKEKGVDYYSERNKLNESISNFFLEDNISIKVDTTRFPTVELYYRPQRNKCYIIQRDQFLEKVNEICKLLDLHIIFRESRCWDTCMDMPLFHEEIVHLKDGV